MAVEFKLVEGVAFTADASRLLRAAWPAPSLHYSREYVGWQLSFPGSCAAPAVAAFSGSTAVGFAASLHRRLRIGASAHSVVVVSFVAVDPAYRGRGVAAGLYQTLLAAIRETGLPIVTFGRADSAGLRAIERSYPAAGFALLPFGVYTPFATMARASESAAEWIVTTEMPRETTCGPVARNAPTPEQFAHYLRDPRPRQFLLHREKTAWAWATRVEYTSATGLDVVTTLESAWIDDPRLLPGLAAAAARLWPTSNPIVHAPNLWGLDPAALRPLGFRQIATPWIGYSVDLPMPATGSNLEIV